MLNKQWVWVDIALPVTPDRWVTQCQSAGYGDSAIRYLSKCLCRGVISNQQIISDDGAYVTIRCTDSAAHATQTRTLSGEDFLKLILQHVVLIEFRRVRDCGFLQGNAKARLKTIQWVLRVSFTAQTTLKSPCFICPHCQQAMVINRIAKPIERPG